MLYVMSYKQSAFYFQQILHCGANDLKLSCEFFKVRDFR